ncbi:hypothetical protein Cantr_00580 [Candida viswanathii]|uniref:Zn(2)-C6 fungal-type domain-containing protein n=1 Tax=Candida viswanathii TaxID=5486 RepID=A0A367YHH9_9ASCO|nr:hypothetical protein Cantr_00580 [Candida viswanathii]
MLCHENPQLILSTTTVHKPKLTCVTSNIKKKQFKIVLGSKVRSRTGCLTCRKRKKKCPEDGPTCLSCKERGQECVWPGTPPRSKATELAVQKEQPRRDYETFGVACPETCETGKLLLLERTLRDQEEEDAQEAMDDIGHVNVNVFASAGVLNQAI